jgi:hypothetical protein
VFSFEDFKTACVEQQQFILPSNPHSDKPDSASKLELQQEQSTQLQTPTVGTRILNKTATVVIRRTNEFMFMVRRGFMSWGRYNVLVVLAMYTETTLQFSKVNTQAYTEAGMGDRLRP